VNISFCGSSGGGGSGGGGGGWEGIGGELEVCFLVVLCLGRWVVADKEEMLQ